MERLALKTVVTLSSSLLTLITNPVLTISMAVTIVALLMMKLLRVLVFVIIQTMELPTNMVIPVLISTNSFSKGVQMINFTVVVTTTMETL